LKATEKLIVEEYSEISGQGISGTVDGKNVLVGSRKFAFQDEQNDSENISTNVFVSIDGKELGNYKISNVYRNGLKEVVGSLLNKYKLYVLSGDNDGERESLKNYFPDDNSLHFNQSPHDKLNFISELQNKNEKVLMIGDGLNDAGALVKSDVGISISEDVNNFSPACDGILDANSFKNIIKFIRFSTTSKKIIIASFVISFIYNLIGISIAVQGSLSPVISAILMPISSITIVVFTTLSTNFLAKRRRFI
jgi:Cu+-exporting ATPase